MKANDTIPVCPCGGTRARVSSQAIYRCPACGDTLYRYKGGWLNRSDKPPTGNKLIQPTSHTTFISPGNGQARHVKLPFLFGKGKSQRRAI